jgi:site-specific recombinase XerC
MQVCSSDATPTGVRDAALIAVLRGTGLRRSEVAALDVADYEPQTGAIVVRAGKGNKDRRVYAPSGTTAALDAWLEVRGRDAGALFGRAVRGGRVGERRLADEGVAVILRDRSAAAGVAPSTHNAHVWLPSRAYYFVVRPHLRLQLHCWAAPINPVLQ